MQEREKRRRFDAKKNEKKKMKLTCRVEEGIPPEPVDPLHDDLLARLVDYQAVLGGEEGGFGGRRKSGCRCRSFEVFFSEGKEVGKRKISL